MSTTFESVQEIISKKLLLPMDMITPESTLTSLELDSLDLIETLFDAEDTFHIRIPQDLNRDTEINTVRDIVDIIDRLISQQNSSELTQSRPFSSKAENLS